jgi:3-(methylthio)propanoyl-CoA dehydrogenase
MQSCNDQMLPKPASAAATISAHVYLNYAEAEVEKHANFISNFDKEDLAFYKK